MAARLRHHRRSGDVWMITINPNNGGLTEQYRVDAVELRRFCWAALADLDPDEAAAAAAEQGATIDALALGERGGFAPRRRSSRQLEKADYPPPPRGTKKFRILQALGEGQRTTPYVADAVPDAERPYDLLRELATSGFVARLQRGNAHQPAVWALTDRGIAALSAEAA